jgi:Zn-dependent protease
MDASLSLRPHPFEHEQQYNAALERLKRGSHPAKTALLLVGSLAAFILLQKQQSDSLLRVGLLVGVVAFHELGHLAGMLAFGYRDVKMFFIPFLGAAVTGRRDGVEAWKEGVVLLLGPLPGIAVGLAISLVVRTAGPPWLRALASMLIVINGFNLLPLAALDGGKVLQITLFARNLFLEVAFLVLAALGLVAYSLRETTDPVLRYGSILLLVSMPFRYRLLRAAEALRAQPIAIPADPRALEGEAGRMVFDAARATVATRHRWKARRVADVMGQLVDLVSRKLPGLRASAGLLIAWALGIALAAGGMWLLHHGRVQWREVSAPGGGWSIWFPAEPAIEQSTTPFEGTAIHYTGLRLVAGANEYVAEAYEVGGDRSWDLDNSARDYAEHIRRTSFLRPSVPKAISFAGREAREVMFDSDSEIMRCIIVIDRKRRFHLRARGKELNDQAEQFLHSFQIAGPR